MNETSPHPIGHVERPSLRAQLRAACSGYPRAYALSQKLIADPAYLASCEAANARLVNRLGYSDHGLTHALIVAVNAMKLYQAGIEMGWEPSFGGVNKKDREDSVSCLLLGALMHDVGNGVGRVGHQRWGIVVAQPILDRVLASSYRSLSDRQKMMLNIMEIILTHDESEYASALEACLVKIADGMDCEGGRSRSAFAAKNTDDRFSRSSEAIDFVHLAPVEKNQPLTIWMEMSDAFGCFQIEQVLMKKIDASTLKGKMVVEAFVGGKRIKRYE